MNIDEYFLLDPLHNSFRFKKRWQTGIQIGLDGEEVRSALFTWPRRSIGMTVFPTNAGDLNYLKRILFKSLHLIWGIPFWQGKTILTSQASSGQKILNVGSTQYRNFEVGGLCLLFISRSSKEVGTIASFTNTQITLVANLGSTWPAQTEVYPMMKSKIQAQQEIDLINPSMGDLAIVATEDFDDGITRHVPSIVDFPTYKYIPVFHYQPRYGQLKQILYRPYDYLAFLGKSYSQTHYGETVLPLGGDYFIVGRNVIQQYLDFFDYHKGRWGQFWVPTHQRDIVVTVAFGVTDTVLTIDPIEYPTYWGGSQAARFIVFRWPDNTLICKKIINSDTTTITLDSAIGKACANPAELIISFLLISRFDMDEIEIDYLLVDEGTTNLRFYSLPQETPA